MNLFSTLKLASSLAMCAALVACETTAEQAPSTALRARAPQGYEKAITNYMAFRIRGEQKNAEISIGTPEPSGCAIEAVASSSRGWVVPVVYATRTGVPSGKETINIATRQYYFWFLGETIAGLSPRIDLCPGAALTEFPQPAADAAVAAAAISSPAKTDASGREGAAAEASKAGRAQDGAKAAGTPKGASANKTKKTAPKPVKTPAPAPDKV